MGLSARNLVVAPYFTGTMSVDAICTAFIAAVVAPGFARTMSVDAIGTAVIVAFDAPVSLALFRLMQYAPLSTLKLMHRTSFALFHLT